MNNVVISGRAWEPKTQYLSSGMCITEFSISAYDGKDKEGKAKYFNVNCKSFGVLAENIGNEVKKGDNVLVAGRMNVETWDKDGVKHYKNTIIVDEIGKTISRFSGQANGNVNQFGKDIDEEICF